jgi:hypothetical protein
MLPLIDKNIKILTPTLLCFLTSAVMLGQTGAGGSGPPAPARCPGCPPPPDLPIDSGMLFLLIVGLGYGIYITIKRMKAKNISQ